ncbi:Rhomboid-like protein 14 [Diplonema papillatum]|nr:Rhomboid-like protein 14 [Diplonema papillatum]
MFFPRHGMRGGGMGRRNGIGLLMLLAQVQRMGGLSQIPTVTLGLFLANVGLFLAPMHALRYSGLYSVCLSYERVVYAHEYFRLVTSGFFHADDWHLCYNMSSMLWKGVQLERAEGTARYLTMMLFLIVMTPLIHIAALHALVSANLDHWGLARECAVGFSGVIFGMKVMTTINSTAMHDVFFGLFAVQGKYVVWAELLLIHLIYPGTSFMGHLSGILAGLLYALGYLSPAIRAVEGAIQRAMDQADRARQDYGRQARNREDQRARDEPAPPSSQRDEEHDRYARQQAAESARRRYTAGRQPR